MKEIYVTFSAMIEKRLSISDELFDKIIKGELSNNCCWGDRNETWDNIYEAFNSVSDKDSIINLNDLSQIEDIKTGEMLVEF